ncbi:MFS transporter [Actinoallomurus soli]|uniref:MFS transporter n=1 Tax=Actinoallomurus soli TaxID=2952535 RepID=UPI0020931250|nr:MFS transporter [Actinoallomurus soli]MCO5967944.1 MFS transporter [Actinoallomurus soli]
MPARVGAKQWIALASVLLATFMGLLDASIVTVAAPSIQRSLGASFGEAQAVMAGYTLAYAVGLVTGGRLGDLYGRRRIFLTGVLLFMIMSAACAAAPTAPVLILARVAQGLAAAVMLPQVLAIIQSSFPGPERSSALGLYGATIGLASIAGQIVGGALLAWNPLGLGWRGVFLVNLPIGLAAIVVARCTVGESRGPRARLDLAGAAVLALALTGLLLPAELGWPLWGWPLLLAGAGLLAGFGFLERGRTNALVPMRLLARRVMVRGLGTVFAFYAGNAGFFLLLAYHLQAGLGESALGSGLIFAPLGVGFAVSSLLGKRLGALVTGTVLMVVSLAAVVLVVVAVPSSSQVVWLLPVLALSGVGEGLVAAPLIGRILAGVDPADGGAASGVLLTATQVANASGVALIGGLFAAVLGGTPGAPGSDFGRYVHATGVSGVVVLVLAALTGVLAHTLGRGRRG